MTYAEDSAFDMGDDLCVNFVQLSMTCWVPHWKTTWSLTFLSTVGRLTYFTDWWSKRNRIEKKMKQKEAGINSVELCCKTQHIFRLRLHATMYVSALKNTSSKTGTFSAHWHNAKVARRIRKARLGKSTSRCATSSPRSSTWRLAPEFCMHLWDFRF